MNVTKIDSEAVASDISRSAQRMRELAAVLKEAEAWFNVVYEDDRYVYITMLWPEVTGMATVNLIKMGYKVRLFLGA